MKTFLFSLVIYSVVSMCTNNNLHQEFKQSKNVKSLFDIKPNEYLGGMDEREIELEEVSIETLAYFQFRQKQLYYIKNEKNSLLLKKEMAETILNENTTMGVNILSGGLIDDWNYEIF